MSNEQEYRKRAIEQALERRAPRHGVVLQETNDWWGVCQKCKERIGPGTVAQLKEHKCGNS